MGGSKTFFVGLASMAGLIGLGLLSPHAALTRAEPPVEIPAYLHSAPRVFGPKSAERDAANAIREHLRERPATLLPGDGAFDAVRRFVTENSTHRIDEAFRAHQDDMSHILTKILAHAQGFLSAPHLECSTRTNALKAILAAHGVNSRRVYLFSSAASVLKSHTLLEVWNSETQRWELHDPDFGLFYLDLASGTRAAAVDLMRRPLEDFVPCKSPADCSWEHASKLRTYFGAVGYKQDGEHPLVVIDPQRFDAAKTNFREYVLRDWGKARAQFVVQRT